jgi:hypothetical protein
MLSLSLSLALLAAAADKPPEAPGAAPPTSGQVRKAVEGSVQFLEKEGVAWKNKQGCASCHHVPLMVWALGEAKNQGYPVPERTLTEMTAWAMNADKRAEVFPDLPLDKKHSEPDYLGPLTMALALGDARELDPAVRKERRRMLEHVVTRQEADGSWNANSGGRPPVHASRDVLTGWLLLALSSPASGEGADDPWKAQREKADRWLAGAAPADEPPSLAIRLLVLQKCNKPARDRKPLLESLLRQQNADGGWAQTKEMKSDAFATGQALYVLSQLGEKSAGEAVGRAQAFLARTQQPDGSWPMTSRPAPKPGPGPARNLGPIRYVGAAWATLGLVRSSPAKAAEKK